MVGCTFQLDFSHQQFSGHSHISLLGLTLAYCASLFSYVRASSVPVNCKSKNISSSYEHCQIQPGGVHALDCFGKHHSLGVKTCQWKPGNGSWKNTYTLIVRQNTFCNAHFNINKFFKNIGLFEKHDVTVEVLENSESKNCTKAVFSASPGRILRCAPYNATFSRHSGGLDLNVSWNKKERTVISYYSVRYKPRSSPIWSEPLLQCKNGARCKVENLTSSLDYNVQIRCVTNKKCSQCVWSEVYTVPEELTSQPVVVHLGVTDIGNRTGQRLLSLSWTFPAKATNNSYHVTIWKASGEEPCERITTTNYTTVRLILSYSAYYLNISTFNNVSTSPVVRRIIPQQENESSMDDLKLSVEVHSSTSFTIHWKDKSLIKKYVCYSVEWTKKGHKTAYTSFYQKENNFRTVSSLTEPLEPYKRYSVTLHTRPYKDTCNMKRINNSESTYGTTQFYFKQGSPVSAPVNVSSFNVTLHSAVLQWSPIPQEDVRGFLLGYIIHYTEYRHTGTSVETNITLDPALTAYRLEDLESETAYKVQLSGFTEAGEGVLSSEIFFKTNNNYSNLSSFITVFAVLAVVLIFGSQIIKRAKLLLWPRIPNPGKSHAMLKMEGPRELELLESISPLKVEEWETSSFQIVKSEEVIPDCTSPLTLPFLHDLEDRVDQSGTTCDWIPCGATEDNLPDITAETNSDILKTDLLSSTFAFPLGYTTMEMFQQVTVPPGAVPASVTKATEGEAEDKDLTPVTSRMDYVGQISTSPILWMKSQ